MVGVTQAMLTTPESVTSTVTTLEHATSTPTPLTPSISKIPTTATTAIPSPEPAVSE